MTSRDFCYWLQGFFEVNEPERINEKQTDLIRKHLNMVFFHEIDPSFGDKEKQDQLNQIHSGKPDKPGKPSRPPFSISQTLIRC